MRRVARGDDSTYRQVFQYAPYGDSIHDDSPFFLQRSDQEFVFRRTILLKLDLLRTELEDRTFLQVGQRHEYIILWMDLEKRKHVADRF